MTRQERKIYKEYATRDISFIDYNSFKEGLEAYGYYTESYFGKSKTLLEMEKILESLIADMKQFPTDDYTNDPRNKKLQDLLTEQFGFKKAYIIWKRYPSMKENVCTMLNVDIIFKGSSIVTIDKKSGYYDKDHKHICVINASATLPRAINLTAEEYMAILLHEIGHNFDYSVYMVVNYVRKILDIIMQAITNVKIQSNRNGITDPTRILSQQIGAATGIAIRQIPPYQQFATEFNRSFERFLDKVPQLKKLFYSISMIESKIARGLEIAMIPVNLIATPINILLSPLTHYMNIPERKTEIFSDSFATVYGYGASLASALTKLEKVNMLKKKSIKQETGLWAIMKDIAMLNRYIGSFIVNPSHGTTDARIKSMITTIEKEIKISGYPREVQNELKEQLREICHAYEYYMNIGDDDVKLTVTLYGRKLINDIFKGNTDFIAKLYPDHLA